LGKPDSISLKLFGKADWLAGVVLLRPLDLVLSLGW
jgi:hypothetical protein